MKVGLGLGPINSFPNTVLENTVAKNTLSTIHFGFPCYSDQMSKEDIKQHWWDNRYIRY